MKRLVSCLSFLCVFFFIPSFVSAAVVNRAGATFKIGTTDIQHFRTISNGIWTFDGGRLSATTATDSSGRGYNGTLNSFTVVKTLPGKKGQALLFDGADDNISMGDVAESAAITLTAWVRPSVNKTGMKIISKRMSGASSQYGLATHGSDSTKFTSIFFSSGISSDICDSTGAAGSYAPNIWYFVAAVYDGDTCKMYVNGVDVTSVTSDNASGAIVGATSVLRIGAEGGATGPSGYFAGLIDDVRIFNRNLTAEEIQMLYTIGTKGLNASASQTTRMTNGLVGMWSFDGPDMLTNVADRSGQGNHGFMTNFGATSTAVRPGKIGQGLVFDGADDKVLTTSDFIGTSAVTISAWIKPTSLGTSLRRIVANGRTDFSIDTSDNRLIFTSDATNARSANNSLIANKWTHVAVTRNASGTANVYVDGVLSGAANQSSGTPVAGTTNVIIGNTSSGTTNVGLAGNMDDVRIYNRVLSSSEINNLYNVGR